MEELLLPNSEEEARSERSSFAAGDSERTMWDRVKSSFQDTGMGDLAIRVKDFSVRNGLLTLSVISVMTGCTLGFMLRGTQLSTQVQKLYLST